MTYKPDGTNFFTKVKEKENAQQPEHCEHECVCWLYPDNFEGACDADACASDTRSRPHTTAPERVVCCASCPCREPDCERDCQHYTILPLRDEQIQAEAAHTATLATLDKFGKELNSRIAKMEILNSNHPSQYRAGIIAAYRDIETLERSLRTAGDEQDKQQKEP
jgi:hypothetical protein